MPVWFIFAVIWLWRFPCIRDTSNIVLSSDLRNWKSVNGQGNYSLNNKLLQEHLVHPHLYWQHIVNNGITCKTSIKPHPPHTPNHFLKTNFVTWSSYVTSSTTYLKRYSSCRKCRKWFPSNQCKIAGGIKNNTFPLIFLLNIEIIRILSSFP